jgi:hypothetical protein
MPVDINPEVAEKLRIILSAVTLAAVVDSAGHSDTHQQIPNNC